MSNIFTLTKFDWIKGLVVAIFAAVLSSLAAAINVPGFDFATFDWGHLLQIAITAGIAYLSKNFLTTSSGDLVGTVRIEK